VGAQPGVLGCTLAPSPSCGLRQGLRGEGSARPRAAAPLGTSSPSSPGEEGRRMMEGARQSSKPLRGRRQSRSHSRWQQGAQNEKFHQAKFGAGVPPSALRGARPGRVAQRWSSSRSEQQAWSPAGLGGSPLLRSPLQRSCQRPAQERGQAAGSRAVAVQLLLRGLEGPTSCPGRERGRAASRTPGCERHPRTGSAQPLCLHHPPSNRTSELLAGAQSSYQQRRPRTSSAAGTRQPPGSLREEPNVDGKLVTLLCPTFTPHLPHQSSRPPGKSCVLYRSTASARRGAGRQRRAPGRRHAKSWTRSRLAPSQAPLTLQHNGRRHGPRHQKVLAAAGSWVPAPAAKARPGQERALPRSYGSAGLWRPFPGKGNAATEPKPGARGRSGESRGELAEPSSSRSLCSLVPRLLEPSPCQHLQPGPAATAADSCHHPQNHRMLGVGRDLCGSSSPTSLPLKGVLQQAAQDLIQAGLEYLQRRRLHSLPGQPGPGLHHPQGEEVLPRVQLELPLLQFVPVAPCLVAGHHWKESGPVLLTPTLQIFISRTQLAVLSPTETWGGTSSAPRASPPATDQAPTASSAHAQLQQHAASPASLAGQQQGLADWSQGRKRVPSHGGTEGTLGTGC